jgi:hypothetical protein
MLAGAAAGVTLGLALLATAGARAQTIYVTEPDAVVAPGYVYSSEPRAVVIDRSTVVAEPPAVVVPRRERVVVAPRREVIIEQPAYVAPRYVRPRESYVTPRDSYVTPRDSFAYRGTVRGGSGIVTTGYSSGNSCVIDINGFERCY